jgi:hypothetical protein
VHEARELIGTGPGVLNDFNDSDCVVKSSLQVFDFIYVDANVSTAVVLRDLLEGISKSRVNGVAVHFL